MNTKVVIDLLDWPQFNAATTGLRLLRQAPTDTSVFTKPSPLGKRHNFDKNPWHINYWVIDKDTSVKVSPTPVKNAASTFDIGNANNKTDIASHWLLICATYTMMDSNQP